MLIMKTNYTNYYYNYEYDFYVCYLLSILKIILTPKRQIETEGNFGHFHFYF